MLHIYLTNINGEILIEVCRNDFYALEDFVEKEMYLVELREHLRYAFVIIIVCIL